MADQPTRTPGPAAGMALVTGAAGHLGASLLRLLAAAGYHTIAVDRPGSTPAAAGRTPNVCWLEADLADPTSEVVLSETLEAVEHLDLVIAAAGVTALGDLSSTADDTFRRVMDVNYHGALRTTRACLPALRRGRGHLVVLSSVAGLLPVPGRPAYVGAKHAVTGVFQAVADELARDRIAVTVVHPGFLDTPVTEVRGTGARSTTGSTITADEVARRILHLAARRRAGRRVPTRLLLGRTAHLA
ncbi:MAG: SDR family NAD(P)-dependent oxidoreductase, partial [Nitriliruptoraceae bacterium]